MSDEFDYIIAGQGLAGTFLSYELNKRGKKILVIDDNKPESSSRVAAGIFNPVTGRRFNKTWLAEAVLPHAEKVYTEMEAVLDDTFYHRRNVFKPFSNIKEKNDWLGKDYGDVQKHITEVKPGNYKGIENEFGGLLLSSAGFVSVEQLMKKYRQYLSDKKLLLSESFDFNELKLSPGKITYKNISAGKLIFCEGYKGAVNPFFSWLPFNPAKGEILTVKIENFEVNEIVSKGIFILPVRNSLYRVGATYSWDDLNEIPTESAKESLIEKLKGLLDLPFEIIEHRAGVRPATRDRRPFLGMHPEHKNLGIFNGLGTKGVLLAPYFASEFAEHLENGKNLNTEADIRRFL